MDRSDLLFAFSDEHQVHRRLAAGATQRMQSGQKRRLRTFLVHRAAPDQHLAESGLVDDARFPRRRRPLARIDLLHVVHEVEAERPGRACVERREHSGKTIRRDALGALESRVLQHAQEELNAFLATDAFRRNGRLVDPFLKPLYKRLRPYREHGPGAARKHQSGGARHRAAQQRSSGDRIHAPP